MKYIFSFTLLLTVFILNIAGIGINDCDKDSTPQNGILTDVNDTNTFPHKAYSFFINSDIPVIPAGLNNLSHTRVPVTTVNVENNPFSLLQSCFSSLSHQKFHIIRSTGISIATKMKKDGYYIYVLRKLLI